MEDKAETTKAEPAKVVKTDAEWRQQLTPEQFKVTRQKGTERAFTGAYHDHKATGTYKRICCGTPLFGSDTKFDSGTGWPSFWSPLTPDHVAYEEVDTPTLKRRGILGSMKPLKLDSLRRLAQRWDSPQALLSECPSVVAFLQVLFGLKQYASKTDSSSSCKSFTCCQEEARTMQQNRIDSIVKVQHVFR